jgi:serine/threonine-protein kinase
VVRRRPPVHLDPAGRPKDIAAFLDLVDREAGAVDELPVLRAQRLLEAVSDTTAAAQLLVRAAYLRGSYELYLEVITRLNVGTAQAALLANPAQTTVVVQALPEHADAVDWPEHEDSDRALWWLLEVARLAAHEEQCPLLDAAVQGMCDWDGRWDRTDIRDWMRTLTGHAAIIVASALRAQPHGARLPYELADERRVDSAIRSAIHSVAHGNRDR